MKETVVIGTVTHAMKGRKELQKRGYRVRLVKASRASERGCVYGLEIDASERYAVYAVLDALSLPYQRGGMRT